MPSTLALIEEKLTQVFHPTELAVTDDSADHIGHANEGSGHFTVQIESADFVNKNAIEKHRMVYDALGTLMQTHIHALRIKASAPEES